MEHRIPGLWFAISLLIASCSLAPPATRSPKDREMDVDTLSGLFHDLESMQLTGYRRDASCEYIVYARGAYSTAANGSNCNAFSGESQQFDAEAREDFRRISTVLAMVPASVTMISDVTFGPNGTISSAWFDFGENSFVGQTYIFDVSDPGFESVEGGATYSRVAPHWFMLVDPVG